MSNLELAAAFILIMLGLCVGGHLDLQACITLEQCQ